jgi:hypothetical protein
MSQSLQDYKEIAQGWEDDVRGSEEKLAVAIADLNLAHKELIFNREHLAKIRSLIAEMERLENVCPKGSVADVAPGWVTP